MDVIFTVESVKRAEIVTFAAKVLPEIVMTLPTPVKVGEKMVVVATFESLKVMGKLFKIAVAEIVKATWKSQLSIVSPVSVAGSMRIVSLEAYVIPTREMIAASTTAIDVDGSGSSSWIPSNKADKNILPKYCWVIKKNKILFVEQRICLNTCRDCGF